jgi:hypothetical protein
MAAGFGFRVSRVSGFGIFGFREFKDIRVYIKKALSLHPWDVISEEQDTLLILDRLSKMAIQSITAVA